jgi:tetratricopeptide (TPR) repeat protein
MKPYVTRGWAFWSLVILLITLALPAEARKPKKGISSQKTPSAKLADDPDTRSGFEHFYNMEYDAAIRDFQKAETEHPNDPFALNHLLTGVMFKELYRIGALDTELYAKDDFLVSKQFPIDPKARIEIKDLMDRAQAASEARLRANPNDVDALYARGVTRAMRSTYIGLIDKAWFSALRSALSARRDHERVLDLDPNYADAKFVVGIHHYLIGSLSWGAKVAASVVGINGNKQKGIQYLYEAAEHGSETAIDARISLSLFLRREQRYPEAIKLVSGLTEKYPKSFLLALEHANLLNAAGKGPDAVNAYRGLLMKGEKNATYFEPKLEQAAWGLGEALRGQREYPDAATAYESVQEFKNADPELRERATLAAGEVYDLMSKRDLAVKRYQQVISADATSWRADLARKYLKQPYRGEKS